MARSDRFSLADQVALVIGGSSGIGRQIALGFQEAGAHVAILGKTPAKVEEVAHCLKVADATVSAYAADVTDLARLRKIMAEIVVREGKLEILINSQGTTLLKPAEEFTDAEFDFIIDTKSSTRTSRAYSSPAPRQAATCSRAAGAPSSTSPRSPPIAASSRARSTA